MPSLAGENRKLLRVKFQSWIVSVLSCIMSPTGTTVLPARVVVFSKIWRMVALNRFHTLLSGAVGLIREEERSLREDRKRSSVGELAASVAECSSLWSCPKCLSFKPCL